MINYNIIKRDITAKLREGFTDARIYWDNIEKAKPPYIYCELSENASTFDPIITDRNIQLRFMVVLPADSLGRVNRSLLNDALKQFDVLLRPNVVIDDRVIFMGRGDTTIVDDIGHYITSLIFADAITDEERNIEPLPLMDEVTVDFNKERKTYNG